MDAVTESLNAMQALHAEDDAMESAIEQEFCEILKSREQTIEAMRAWVDQLDPDEVAQKLAEFLLYRYASYSGGPETSVWWSDLNREARKYADHAGIAAITSAARSNILRRRELVEQDGVREPWEGES